MPFLVRAFPLLPGKEHQLRMMAQEISGPRQQQMATFLRSLGVSHESWHVQKTAEGQHVIIVITRIDDAEARAKEYAVRDEEFTEWFKSRVRSLSGIDPDTQPLGPSSEQVFEWEAS